MNKESKILFKNRVVEIYSQVWETGSVIKKGNNTRVEISRNENLINSFFVYDSELFYGQDIYDEFGVLRTQLWEDIKKGDKVVYYDTISIKDNGRWKNVKVPLEGVWDGEKVQFDDKDKTLVRTTRWLKKI